jgi:hypothetical protein
MLDGRGQVFPFLGPLVRLFSKPVLLLSFYGNNIPAFLLGIEYFLQFQLLYTVKIVSKVALHEEVFVLIFNLKCSWFN